MGCCHARNVSATQDPTSKIPPKANTVEVYAFDSSTHGEPFHALGFSDDRTFAEELRDLTEHARRAQDYGELAFLATNSMPAFKTTGLLWASAPKTIGCLAISYLAADLLEQPAVVGPYVRSVLPCIVHAINSGSDDLRDNSLLFLLGFLDVASKDAIEELVELKICNAVVRYFVCSQEELRLTAAACCYKMCTNSVAAQTDFVGENGVKMLLSLIASSKHSPKQVRLLVSYLEALVVHCAESLHKLVACHLWVAHGWDTLAVVSQAVDCPATHQAINKILDTAKAYQLSSFSLEPVEAMKEFDSSEESEVSETIDAES